ncbi:MAG: hypothetical protein JW764_00365 [Chlorobiaceae bacterium]|nr:hypothetical protein [Chlorobiaceae bacterium]
MAIALMTAFILPPIALAGSNTIKVTVKPTSKVSFTSIKVRTDNGPVVVNPPAGWTATKVPRSTREWNITGGSIPPGGSMSLTLSVGGNRIPDGSVIGGDYKDKNGNTRWVTTCPDPLSQIVIFADGQDIDYLGYSIPEGEYGYFFEWWNPDGFTDITKTATIDLGLGVDAYNFAVISNSFSLTELSQLEGIQIIGNDALITTFMDEDDATGNPGIPVSWNFDSGTGVCSTKCVNDHFHN